MWPLTAAFLSLVALPSPASAERFTFGISVGHTEGGDSGLDPESARGVFGELRIHRRASLQLEVSRHTREAYEPTIRRVAGSLLVDLTGPRRATPFFLAGVGDDRVAGNWLPDHYRTREIGIGVRYQVGGGLVLGADVRRGQRGAVDPPIAFDDALRDARPFLGPLDDVDRWDGYTALRISLGVAF